MDRIIRIDGTELGLTDEARYIKYGSCGQFVQTTRADAIGVAFKNAVYNLLGHNDIAEADTVIVSRASTADELETQKAELSAQRDVAEIIFVSLAETGTIDEVTATEHVDVFEQWVYPKAYSVGKIVQDGGKLYKCVQAHTSQADWPPADTPALWNKIGDPTEEYPEWSQPLGAHDAYPLGAKVSQNGKKWVSDVASNVWEPGVYGWTEVAETEQEGVSEV